MIAFPFLRMGRSFIPGIYGFSSGKFDPYQVLGVTSATTNDDVKNAFHRLSKLCNLHHINILVYRSSRCLGIKGL